MLITTLCVVLCKKHVLPTQKKTRKKSTIMTVLKGVDDIYDLRVNFITQCWILHAICMWSLQCSFSERGSWLPPQVQMCWIYAGGPHGPLYYCLWLTDCVIWMAHLRVCVYILRAFLFTEFVLLIFDYDTESKVENDKMLLNFKKPCA